MEIEIHCISLKGKRHANEDVMIVKKNRRGGDYSFAIFDGHGGSYVSEYLGRHLLPVLAKIPPTRRHIRAALRQVHSHMAEKTPRKVDGCGSTVLVCRVDPVRRHVQAINLGDSRAILRERDRLIELTVDHKPETFEERVRITAAGHKVMWDEEDEVHRVLGYSVSRTLGDTDGEGALSRECDVTDARLGRGCSYLLMACDGVWDVMTSAEVAAFLDPLVEARARLGQTSVVQHRCTQKNIAYRLARHAIARGSMDNVSIILVLMGSQ